MAVEYSNPKSFIDRVLLGSILYSSSRKIACNKYREHSTPSGSLSTLKKMFIKFITLAYYIDLNCIELPGFPHCHLI
jgi:hypothetical protein